jgi:hypothetical protein
MSPKLFFVSLLAIFTFASIAMAGASNPSGCTSTDPAVGTGWIFQTLGYCGDLSGGVSFTASNLQVITIYPEKLRDGVVQANTSSDYNYIDGLFEVQDGHNGNIASGIGPYVGSNGAGSPYTGQLGLQDWDSSGHHYDYMLFIKITGGNGAGQIPTGTTLNFLMQQGDQSLDAVDVHWDVFGAGQSTPPNISALTHSNLNVAIGAKNGDATTPQFSITTSTDGAHPIEWIAIQADCQYILLNAITETYSKVPEPRFYGLLLVSLIGLAGVYQRRKRQAAAQL